jgi:2-methylisocitrate lyase-like PEP mutase family enzyme
MSGHAEKAARFMALHQQDHPLVLANAWDVGSARLLASLGFDALATTSSGYAATLGRLDYGVSREEALAHAEALVAATDVPVSADFEDGFARDPAGVAETVLSRLSWRAAPSRTGVRRTAGSTVPRQPPSASRRRRRPPTPAPCTSC